MDAAKATVLTDKDMILKDIVAKHGSTQVRRGVNGRRRAVGGRVGVYGSRGQGAWCLNPDIVSGTTYNFALV